MSTAPTRTGKTADVLVGALLFAALGPAIGALVLIVVSAFSGIGQDRPLAEAIGSVALLYVFSLLFAYPLAVVPAALTGGCAGSVRHRLRAPLAWCAMGVLGAVVSLGWMALALNALQFESDFLLYAAAGFLAGSVCTWLLGRLFAWRDRRRGGEAPPPRPEP